MNVENVENVNETSGRLSFIVTQYLLRQQVIITNVMQREHQHRWVANSKGRQKLQYIIVAIPIVVAMTSSTDYK